jgi:ketosteroid isomerase-like protein
MARALAIGGFLLTLAVGSVPGSDIEDLVAAEHRFAAAAAANGMRDAFLAVLSEQGILFRPRPVNGRAWFGERPAPPGTLAWVPIHADVSGAGDLGYTTGPWRYDVEGRDPAFGHYVSIWSRDADDRWWLELDLGVGHDELPPSAWEQAVEEGRSTHRGSGMEPEQLTLLRRQLVEADGELSRVLSTEGASTAYSQMGSDRLRVYRDGRTPIVGLVAVREALDGTKPPRQPRTTSSDVADSGDLGYTFGATAESDEPEPDGFGYARIWRRDAGGTWKVVLDIAIPVP